MNNRRQNERLLADVLGEGVAGDFREGILNETLRLARRRRRMRQMRAPIATLAVMVVVALLVWTRFPAGRIPGTPPATPYLLVRTQPLAPAACISTQPLSPDRLVASARTENVVTTALLGTQVRDITDEELLALAPKPAALVRFGPHSAELVFVSREETEEKQKY